MRGHDQRRRPLPAQLSAAEHDFYSELRRLIDMAGLTCRALETATSSAQSDSGDSLFYSKSRWGRWINGQSRPPRKAIRKLTEKLASDDIRATHLLDLWGSAFAPLPEPRLPADVPAGWPGPVTVFLGGAGQASGGDMVTIQIHGAGAAGS